METDSSDSSSSTSEKNLKTENLKTDDYEEENDVEDEDEDEQIKRDKGKNLKNKGKITLEDLTPSESLSLKLDDNVQIIKMGRVLSIVDNKLFVIQSFIEENLPPFDEGTIFFDAARNAIGKIHETFGPVANPFYTIRKTQEATVELNSFVFFVPNSNDYTKYIFNVEELRKLKGSDASWNNDNEPPEEYLDYSDDEKEKIAKKQLKLKKIKEKNENDWGLSTDEDCEDDDDDKEEQEKRIEKTQSIGGNNQFKQRNKDNRIEYNKMKKANSFFRSHQTSSNNQPYRQSTFKNSNSSFEMFNSNSAANNNSQRINIETSINNINNNMPTDIQSNMQFNRWPNQMPFMPQYNPYFTPFYNNFLPSTPNLMTPPPHLMQQLQFQPYINQHLPNIRPNYINNQMNQPQVMDRRFVQNQQFIKKSF